MRGAGGVYPMREKGTMASQPTTGAAGEQHQVRERRRIMAAMLEVSGELGYRRATVRRVIERSGARQSQFYGYFCSKEDCFVAAYEAEAESLCSALIEAAHSCSSWREGLRAALAKLFDFATERPLIARAILREVYTARGPALVKHEEVLGHLSHAIDGACHEPDESRHAPPPMTGSFMVGAIEAVVRAQIAARRPERLWAAMPELMYLLVAPYLGDEIAREELTRPVPKTKSPTR
jgi:AcrR family transcriptional regulator